MSFTLWYVHCSLSPFIPFFYTASSYKFTTHCVVVASCNTLCVNSFFQANFLCYGHTLMFEPKKLFGPLQSIAATALSLQLEGIHLQPTQTQTLMHLVHACSSPIFLSLFLSPFPCFSFVSLILSNNNARQR